MDKDQILTLIKDIEKQSHFYTYQNLPCQIGNAIYLYGSNTITDIIAFIDSSIEQDGSQGMIITPDYIYYQFEKNGSFAYQDITALSLEKHRHDTYAIISIQTKNSLHVFKNTPIDENILINYLSEITNIDVEMILTVYEKVAYYISVILHDIENDEYEDIILTTSQQKQIEEFYQELDIINTLDDENYQFELKKLCPKALQFFDNLELDSDEIDILLGVQEEFNKENQKDDQMFDHAKKYYDDMMNKYKHGDSSMFDQLQNMMRNLGINPDDLKGKSPEELNQYIDDLCDRFHISRSQLDSLINKFNH